MLGKLFAAGMIVVLGMALIPAINEFLTTFTNDVMANTAGITEFELTYWRMVPIILAVYVIVVLPLMEIMRGIRRRGEPGERGE